MYSKNEEEVFKILNSNIDGLDSKETEKRLNDYGQNIILNKKKTPWILRFLKQFNDDWYLFGDTEPITNGKLRWIYVKFLDTFFRTT